MSEKNPLEGMPYITITFDESSDERSQWADLDAKAKDGKLIETTGLRCLMTPNAMASGGAALGFRFDLTDGTTIVAHVSVGNIMGQLVPAIRGRCTYLGLDELGKPKKKNGDEH